MSLQEARDSMGIPRLQHSSNLWSHVFGKGPATSESGSKLPALGPIDKNATSTRVLLYDTQANIEKFSARVDSLLSSFSEAKSEVKLVKTLFERDRETLTKDVIELVDRCQTNLQKKLGSPAQSPILENFTREVSLRLDNLDKRLDAIQTLSQSHAQSLQTQIQAIQILQEQHCTMLATITPLLPLLQAVPLHIDSAKHFILDALRQPTHSQNKATQTSPISNKRPRTTSERVSLMSHARKRSRADSVAEDASRRPSLSPVQGPSDLPEVMLSRRSTHTLSASRSNVPSIRPQTPGQKHVMPIDHLTPAPARDFITVGQDHLPTLVDHANVSPGGPAEITNPFINRTSMIHQPPRGRSLAPLTSQAEITAKAGISPRVSDLANRMRTVNNIRTMSTKGPSKKTVPQGLQLKPPPTLIPAKNGFPPPRRRRSPPKEGRRFIPLLDSDDEDIASPR